jgi:hypothetical protein
LKTRYRSSTIMVPLLKSYATVASEKVSPTIAAPIASPSSPESVANFRFDSPHSVAASSQTSQGSPLPGRSLPSARKGKLPSPLQARVRPPVDASATATPPSKKQTLRELLHALHAPWHITGAIDIIQDCRQRLTTQVFYAAPSIFEDCDCVGEHVHDHEIPLLKLFQLGEAAKLLKALGKYATIRAVVVLLGNERHAFGMIRDWLLSIEYVDSAYKVESLGCVRRSLKELHSAVQAFHFTLMPAQVELETSYMLLRCADAMLVDTEVIMISEVGIKGNGGLIKASRAKDDVVMSLLDLELRSWLDSTAKDLAAVKIVMELN